jgi:hypothetical protein
MDGLFDHDALLADRKGMSLEESERHYLQTEMIDPLDGGLILGGYVDNDCGFNIPVLRIMVKGKIYQVVVAADDEINDGGRLMIYPEMEGAR